MIRDVNISLCNLGFPTLIANFIIKQNDYVDLEVANNAGAGDLKAQLDSTFSINARN